MGKKAIITVDVQSGLFKPEFVDVEELSIMLKGTQEIIRCAKENGIYTILVEWQGFDQVPKEIAGECKDLPRFYKEETSALADVGTYDLHYDRYRTRLDSLLKHQGISSLVVIGVNAPDCANSTISDARDLGYEVITSPDLILDRIPTVRDCGRSLPFLEKNVNRLFPDYHGVVEYLTKNL